MKNFEIARHKNWSKLAVKTTTERMVYTVHAWT